MELLMHPGAGASLLSVHDPLPLDPGRDPLYKQQYADASVLYCRVVGLDDVMYGTPAEDQLKWLHRLHICINSLLKQMPVMKVDLSGGVILFASGVENEDRNHADSLLQLAKTLLGAIQSMKLPDGRPLRMQMGLHSGEVASGVIGSLALRYRVYGSTVSVAKQLGAFSAPGMLRLSSESWSRLTATHGLVLADPVKLADWSQVDSYLLGSLPHFSPADLRMANAAAREGTDQARELLVFKDPRLEVPFKRLYYGPRRVPDALAFVLLLCLAAGCACSLWLQGQLGNSGAAQGVCDGVPYGIHPPSLPTKGSLLALGVPSVIVAMALTMNLLLPEQYFKQRDLLLVTHRLACILLLSMPHSSRVYAYLCGNVRWGLAAWNPLLGQAGLSALHMMLWPSIPLPAGGAPASGLAQALAFLALSAALPVRFASHNRSVVICTLIVLAALGWCYLQTAARSCWVQLGTFLLCGAVLSSVAQYCRERSARREFLRQVC